LVKHRIAQSAIVLVGFIIDRITKLWAIRDLEPVGNIPLTPFFHLTYLENTGAAWGMFKDGNTPLIFVSIVLLIGLAYFRKTWRRDDHWSQYGAALVFSGALGNLYDRIAYQAVVDFLDFLVWPVFNVADSCITVGACMLAWGMHKEDGRTRKGTASSDA